MIEPKLAAGADAVPGTPDADLAGLLNGPSALPFSFRVGTLFLQLVL